MSRPLHDHPCGDTTCGECWLQPTDHAARDVTPKPEVPEGMQVGGTCPRCGTWYVPAAPTPKGVVLRGLEREALGDAQHQTWHIGCTTECGARLDDQVKSDRAIVPAVERIVTARLAAERAAHEGLIEAALAIVASLDDPRIQRPGMQRRRTWANHLHRAVLAAGVRGE